MSFASNGIKVFLPYLMENHLGTIPLRPSDMGPADVARYVAWLRLKYPNGSTAKNYYSAFKSVVIGLMDYGFIDRPHQDLLPANPFPMNAKVIRGETSLSQAEMQKLANALKADLIAIHHGRFTGLESEAIVALMLIVGMRSGINATPLLEMKRDCLEPHPFMPNLMLVRTFKRRGKGAQSTSLRQTHIHDLAASIPMDGVAVLKKALEMTQDLIESWLGDQPLSGGAGREITKARAITLKSRAALLAETAAQVHIRATGHGWCLAQEKGCGGAGLYEATLCVGCKNGVIDESFTDIWKGIYEQQTELLAIDDAGPAVKQRAERDVQWARQVMVDLGVLSTQGTSGLNGASNE